MISAKLASCTFSNLLNKLICCAGAVESMATGSDAGVAKIKASFHADVLSTWQHNCTWGGGGIVLSWPISCDGFTRDVLTEFAHKMK